MAELIKGNNISTAWLQAVEHLAASGGRDVNLSVAIEDPTEEDTAVRRTLDSFLRSSRLQSVNTVANTIFPQSLYRPERGESARPRLYQLSAQARKVASRHKANQFGMYFGRLVDWPGGKSGINQLEETVVKLKREISLRSPKSSIYELGIGDVVDRETSSAAAAANGLPSRSASLTQQPNHMTAPRFDTRAADLRVYAPGIDKRLMGFPCLSHVSLTLHKQRLHMAAIYRNQYFVQKAYGNYVGLSRLLLFLCREAGCEPGEILCVATHADAELSRTRLQALIEECRTAIAATSTSVEHDANVVIPLRK